MEHLRTVESWPCMSTPNPNCTARTCKSHASENTTLELRLQTTYSDNERLGPLTRGKKMKQVGDKCKYSMKF